MSKEVLRLKELLVNKDQQELEKFKKKYDELIERGEDWLDAGFEALNEFELTEDPDKYGGRREVIDIIIGRIEREGRDSDRWKSIKNILDTIKQQEAKGKIKSYEDLVNTIKENEDLLKSFIKGREEEVLSFSLETKEDKVIKALMEYIQENLYFGVFKKIERDYVRSLEDYGIDTSEIGLEDTKEYDIENLKDIVDRAKEEYLKENDLPESLKYLYKQKDLVVYIPDFDRKVLEELKKTMEWRLNWSGDFHVEVNISEDGKAKLNVSGKLVALDRFIRMYRKNGGGEIILNTEKDTVEQKWGWAKIFTKRHQRVVLIDDIIKDHLDRITLDRVRVNMYRKRLVINLPDVNIRRRKYIKHDENAYYYASWDEGGSYEMPEGSAVKLETLEAIREKFTQSLNQKKNNFIFIEAKI